MNHKRVQRLWRQAGLKVPSKQPKRGHPACPTHRITGQSGSTTTVPDCDDGDACTLDSCSDGECYHGEIVCPESDRYCDGPPSCDADAGCVFEDPPCVSDGLVCDEITRACVQPGKMILIDLVGSGGRTVWETLQTIDVSLDTPLYSIDNVAITLTGTLSAGEVNCWGDSQSLPGSVCVMVGDDYTSRLCTAAGYPHSAGDQGSFEYTESTDALLAALQMGSTSVSFWVQSWDQECDLVDLPHAFLDRATLRLLGQPMFDANVDDKIDSTDALFALDCMEGSAVIDAVECGIFDADLDNDVDLRDMAHLQRKLDGGR